jgi:FtsP/CotA-like multicopper oxidase with cupredoxin domain
VVYPLRFGIVSLHVCHAPSAVAGVTRAGQSEADPTLSRRRLLGLGAGLGGVVASATILGAPVPMLAGSARAAGATRRMLIGPSSPLVAAAERARPHSGRTVRATLVPGLMTLDLAGTEVQTWGFGQEVPGPTIRARPGDELAVTVTSGLPTLTSVHWHGIQIRNNMDGVPGMTEPGLESDQTFTYRFIVPDAGSYWYHSHVGVQPDRGLYGPLVVEDPQGADAYDQDLTVMIDDWVDGLVATPDQVLSRLLAGEDTGVTAASMDPSSPWGPMLGDVVYPFHLINGRPVTDPVTWRARPGQRLRLRLYNAGADTDYRVALAGHRLTVTHTDGWAVDPVTVDTLLIGKGERYDVTVAAADGVFPLVAVAEGKHALARAVLRTGSGRLPPPSYTPAELDGRRLTYADLRPAVGTTLPRRHPDREVQLLLGRDPSVPYRWLIDKRAAPHTEPVVVEPGERLRITYVNTTTMAHPMHLHGHTFALAGSGVRKDTVVVLPGHEAAIDVEADNPGQWMLHCHDLYHQNAGMMTTLSYVS